MKSVTEFAVHILTKGIQAKAALVAESKAVEEIQAALGTAFKYEGDKLKYFWNALEVAEKNQEDLGRVLVVSLVEGESVPPKAVKVEEQYYVPEFRMQPTKAVHKNDLKSDKGDRKKGGGQKESPWGLSPEQKAAKKGAGKAKAAAAAAAAGNKPS